MTVQEAITLKVWFTAQEMADAARAGQLPGMPKDKSNILRTAERECWDSYPALIQTEKARGGTITRYHIDLLPLDVKLAYIVENMPVSTTDSARPMPGEEVLSEEARAIRDAKIVIVRIADRWRRNLGMTAAATDALFVNAFNGRNIPMFPDWVFDVVPKLSKRTLYRWREKLDRHGTVALAHDRSAAKKDKGLLDTANDGSVKTFILGCIAKNPAFSAKHIRTYCRDEFGDELVARNGELQSMPPIRTFQHFIAKMRKEHKVALTAITDPDRFRSHYKMAGNNTASRITIPNRLWQIDASPLDAMCTDGRHSIYACIDIATRRAVISVSRTPRAEAVGLLVRKMILKHGVAETIKTDNGSDFVAKATKRLFDALDIEMEISPPYTPEDKGFVERFIKTIQHDFSVQSDGYIGHNPGERKAIEGRKSFSKRLGASDAELFDVKLTAAEFQEKIDDWVEYVYHREPHEGLKGKTPNEVAFASSEAIRRVDERALDVLLMPVPGNDGIRTFRKQGLEIDEHWYGADNILPGTKVLVRHDPADMGRVLISTAEGDRFLGEAICPELAGIDPQRYWAAKKTVHKDFIQSQVKPIADEARRFMKGPSGIDRTLAVARRDAAKEAAEQANVINMPKRSEDHRTPAIDAALDAATASQRRNVAKPLNEKAAELHAAIVREAERKADGKVLHINPDDALSEGARNFKWAKAVEGQIAAGLKLSAEEAVKLTHYQSSTDYQIRMDMLEFGMEAALNF